MVNTINISQRSGVAIKNNQKVNKQTFQVALTVSSINKSIFVVGVLDSTLEDVSPETTSRLGVCFKVPTNFEVTSLKLRYEGEVEDLYVTLNYLTDRSESRSKQIILNLTQTSDDPPAGQQDGSLLLPLT
ncbi:MAG: hypothetical protein OXR68_07980 [Alphaproteobacteria bacterium]|nr:hypothetical protein [Alphaproteobacteria bacterium]MDD9920543.1 hypothetical protein [Alphaproteobacteria bacterium]